MIIEAGWGKVSLDKKCPNFNTKHGAEFIYLPTGRKGKVLGTGEAICGKTHLWVSLEGKYGYYHFSLEEWMNPEYYQKL